MGTGNNEYNPLPSPEVKNFRKHEAIIIMFCGKHGNKVQGLVFQWGRGLTTYDPLPSSEVKNLRKQSNEYIINKKLNHRKAQKNKINKCIVASPNP